MKCYKQIISVFLAVAIAFACCLPAVVTPAHAAALDQFPSDTSITLNNNDVLRVPAEAISGNYIVYRVNNGAYRYYVIDVFESTDGVKELAFLTFDRYIAQSAITNANALNPNVWTKITMKNVLYAISGALTVRPMYSTFDYYDALGFLLIGGAGTDHTEDEYSSTLEVDAIDRDYTIPREISGNHFMIVDDPNSRSVDSFRVFEFPNLSGNSLQEGDISSYVSHYISMKEVMVHFTYEDVNYTVDLPNDFPFQDYPYCYFFRYGSTFNFFASDEPAFKPSGYVFQINATGSYYHKTYNITDGTWSDYTFTSKERIRISKSTFSSVTYLWSNSDLYDGRGTSASLVHSASSSCVNYAVNTWGSSSFNDVLMSVIQDGWEIKYSTFDYYDKNGNLYFSNSFAGEVTEDDSLIDLTLDDGTVIRVPERFGERDSYFVVMDPVGGTEETAYLIYEFDYYEGVADGTVCDFTRWYGVATTEQVEVSVTDPDTGEVSTGVETVTLWEWNYQDYYVTELDILDYGPIVYSTFEYVDGRTEDDESGDDSSGSAESKEFFAWFKGQWVKFTDKLYKLLEDIRAKVGGGGLSISIENNTIIDDEDKEPFNPDVYKGVIKTLRNSVKLFSGFFGFIYDGVNNFIVYLTDTSSEFYGLFHLSELG